MADHPSRIIGGFKLETYKGFKMVQEQSNLWAKSYINDGYLMLPDMITSEECDRVEGGDAENLSG